MQIKITIDDDIYEELKNRATQDSRPVSNYINLVLIDHVKNHAPFNSLSTATSQSQQPYISIPGVKDDPIPQQPYKITLETNKIK